MGIRPVGLSFVVVTQPEQKPLESLLGAAKIPGGIGAGPTQIAHRFIHSIRHMDTLQFTGTMKARQINRIAFVGLEPVPTATR